MRWPAALVVARTMSPCDMPLASLAPTPGEECACVSLPIGVAPGVPLVGAALGVPLPLVCAGGCSDAVVVGSDPDPTASGCFWWWVVCALPERPSASKKGRDEVCALEGVRVRVRVRG